MDIGFCIAVLQQRSLESVLEVGVDADAESEARAVGRAEAFQESANILRDFVIRATGTQMVQ